MSATSEWRGECMFYWRHVHVHVYVHGWRLWHGRCSKSMCRAAFWPRSLSACVDRSAVRIPVSTHYSSTTHQQRMCDVVEIVHGDAQCIQYSCIVNGYLYANSAVQHLFSLFSSKLARKYGRETADKSKLAVVQHYTLHRTINPNRRSGLRKLIDRAHKCHHKPTRRQSPSSRCGSARKLPH